MNKISSCSEKTFFLQICEVYRIKYGFEDILNHTLVVVRSLLEYLCLTVEIIWRLQQSITVITKVMNKNRSRSELTVAHDMKSVCTQLLICLSTFCTILLDLLSRIRYYKILLKIRESNTVFKPRKTEKQCIIFTITSSQTKHKTSSISSLPNVVHQISTYEARFENS